MPPCHLNALLCFFSVSFFSYCLFLSLHNCLLSFLVTSHRCDKRQRAVYSAVCVCVCVCVYVCVCVCVCVLILQIRAWNNNSWSQLLTSVCGSRPLISAATYYVCVCGRHFLLHHTKHGGCGAKISLRSGNVLFLFNKLRLFSLERIEDVTSFISCVCRKQIIIFT